VTNYAGNKGATIQNNLRPFSRATSPWCIAGMLPRRLARKTPIYAGVLVIVSVLLLAVAYQFTWVDVSDASLSIGGNSTVEGGVYRSTTGDFIIRCSEFGREAYYLVCTSAGTVAYIGYRSVVRLPFGMIWPERRPKGKTLGIPPAEIDPALEIEAGRFAFTDLSGRRIEVSARPRTIKGL
jgi:hypothetical protein